MHHIFFCHGFNSFFKRPHDRLRRTPLDDLERNHPLSQEFQRPTYTPFGLGAARQSDQPGLFLPIEHRLDAGTNLPLTLQGRVQPFFHIPLAKRLDRPHRHAERRGSLRVFQLRATLRLVYRQQDVRVTNPQRRRLARANQLLQPISFLGLQPNHISLHGDPP